MTIDEDRRGDLRGVRQERLFVKVTACAADSELENTTIGCQTKDVSASGIQLTLEQGLPVQTELELWVEIKGVPGKFLLHGEVVWSGEENGEYCCGVELDDDSEDTDLDEWQALFQ